MNDEQALEQMVEGCEPLLMRGIRLEDAGVPRETPKSLCERGPYLGFVLLVGVIVAIAVGLTLYLYAASCGGTVGDACLR